MVSSLLLVQAIGQRRSGRLVDDAHHFQAGDLAGVLGGLALRIVEVSRDGDHGLGDLLAQVGLGGFLQLGEDHGRDFRRRVLLAADIHADVVAIAAHHVVGHHLHLFADLVVAAPHEALDGEDGVLRVGDGLALGDLSHQPFAALGERDNRGGGAGALLVGNDGGLSSLHDGDHRVGGAQIDTDDLSHCDQKPPLLYAYLREKTARPEWVPI